MKILGTAAFLVAVFTAARPVSADHPGENLDAVMGGKETYFQTVDKVAPPFALSDADGKPVDLTDFNGKVVVMNFIYTSCPDVCPLHAEKIAAVQAMINGSPMKDMVQFISVTTDPANDTPDILASYGPDHGLDALNWKFLTVRAGQGEAASRKLAESYGHKFEATEDGFQAHGIVTHVIDGAGRWAANFHGLKFKSVNLVLYINGLINNENAPATSRDSGWFEKMKELF